MTEDPHRDFCRRQHRIIANYLSYQAWARCLDCIVLNRSDLEYFLGIKRFKSARVDWLQSDLKPWFNYQQAYYKTGAPSSIHSLFLSRVPIAIHLPKGSMTTAQRIERMAEDAPPTAEFLNDFLAKPPTESGMISELSLLACGLSTPRDINKPPEDAKARPKKKTAAKKVAPKFTDP